MTPAGEQFFQTLRNIREELKAAIEQGQNFSARYRSAVMIALPMRSCLYYLPEAMKAFEKTHPDVTVMPHFFPFSDFSSFLKSEEDLIFAMAGDAKGIPDVHSYPLFDSRIYLITKKDDPLAGKDIVRPEDLRGRTLMVGGGSPPPLRRVQKRMIEEVGVDFFTSHDHETTLTNVAAGRGVCLAPGFLDDHNGNLPGRSSTARRGFPASFSLMRTAEPRCGGFRRNDPFCIRRPSGLCCIVVQKRTFLGQFVTNCHIKNDIIKKIKRK